MKNPLEKDDDHTVLVTAIAVGAVVGLGLTYLYLTEKGAVYRNEIAEKFKDKVSDKAAGVINKKTRIPKRAVKIVTDHIIK